MQERKELQESGSRVLVGQTQQHNLVKNRVSKILDEEDTENQMVVQNISNSGIKIKSEEKH